MIPAHWHTCESYDPDCPRCREEEYKIRWCDEEDRERWRQIADEGRAKRDEE